MTKTFLSSFAATAILAAACGGTTVVASTESTSTGSGSGSGSGSGASGTTSTSNGMGVSGTGTTTSGSSSSGTGGSPNVGCPTAQPSGSCASYPNGLTCTYGDSVRPDCRESTICDNGQWETAGTACVMSTSCPATEPATGDTCSLEPGTECTYGNDLCFCGCGGGPACAVPPWSCSAPPASPCPSVVPNDGTACTDPGLSCTYGNTCSGGAEADCTDGFWRWRKDIACPV